MNVELQKLDLALQLTREITRGDSFDEIFDTLYKQARKLIPCDRVAAGFLHADGHTLVLGPVRASGKILLDTGYRESIGGTHLEKVLRSGKIRILNDLAQYAASHADSTASRLLVGEGMKASLTVPLEIAGDPIGALWFSSRKKDAYSAEHETFMRLIAGQLAIILERARMVGRTSVDRVVKERLQIENVQLRDLVSQSTFAQELIGSSAPWRKMVRKMEMVAPTDSTVLIRGETGTGKELIARAIHKLSRRQNRSFIAVNCGALSRELIESELFGHERGAFTGAIQRKLGRIELAHGGTLFLDEVGELRPETQVNLLRVLQEHEFERVGSAATVRADVRVIAATNRNLEEMRAAGQFRDDLFFRLNVFPVIVPPLRERKEDIAPMLEAFVRRYAHKIDRTFDQIDGRVLERCLLYHWPGNVRELENMVERGVILSSGGIFTMDPLLEADSYSASASGNLALDEIVRAHIQKVLKTTHGKLYGVDGAASVLGVKPSTLQAKMKKLGIVRRPISQH